MSDLSWERIASQDFCTPFYKTTCRMYYFMLQIFYNIIQIANAP